MIKSNISDRLFDLLDGKISKNQAANLVDTAFDIIKQTLASGEEVKISSFGSFKVVHKAARTGRNPQTGEPLSIPARHIVKFKASSVFRRGMR